MKANQNKRKIKSQALKKANDEKNMKKQQAEWRSRHLNKVKEEKGQLVVKDMQTGRKRLSRCKQREENPKKVKEDQLRWAEQFNLNQTEEKRIKKFLRSTLYNAIFTCICCQRNLFESNVHKVDSKLIADIETKKKGLFKLAIEFFDKEPLRVNINGEEASYICLACKGHLHRGKIPPMATKNGLKIYKHDPELELTELEGNLIAKNIMFMKIFQMPRSRWSALKDKIVNVPVTDEDIVNTVTKLPRTPNEAGLIEVSLKRKLEYKNAHAQQLINPQKCFKMLELLKRSRNPYYQFYDDFNVYSERCRKEDAEGYSILFEEETEVMKDITSKKLDDKTVCQILEEEWLEKDPIRRFQFEGYNKSLCMANMYPEMDPDNAVIVAPGEGKVPKYILHDKDWDIKGFPQLNSPDGKYGLHHERLTKLTDQQYFIQRICNRDPKFAKCLPYVYAAVGYIETKQIANNMSISYSRGREVRDEDGRISLKMENPHTVLDNIKQTHRYWQTAKYEMYAKLDNFGPFQVFFTLSSPELRHDENFAAILRERNLNIRYLIEKDEDGYPVTCVYVDYVKDGKNLTKRVKNYIQEELEESLHECIRGNVLIATRYFNHRVKAFVNHIIQGKGNPMNVDKFSYRTEFQV